jgi:hypothetical protein
LPLSIAQLREPGRGFVGDGYGVEGGIDSAAIVGGEASEEAGVGVSAEGDEVIDGESAAVRLLGEDDTDRPCQFLLCIPPDGLAEEVYFAAGRRQEAAEGSQEGGLAGAVDAEQAGECGMRGLEVEAGIDDVPLSAFAGVTEAKAAGFDGRHVQGMGGKKR